MEIPNNNSEEGERKEEGDIADFRRGKLFLGLGIEIRADDAETVEARDGDEVEDHRDDLQPRERAQEEQRGAPLAVYRRRRDPAELRVKRHRAEQEEQEVIAGPAALTTDSHPRCVIRSIRT